MYIKNNDYTALYEPMEEKVFERLAYDACRHMDRLTTGVDGVKKLRVAFPAEEDAATAVKHCAARIINLLHQIQEAEQSAALARGYAQTANGLQGKVIASVSAGNESVSFAAGSTQKTAVDLAVSDVAAKRRMIADIVREHLSGVADANGVSLLYMGVYPYAV